MPYLIDQLPAYNNVAHNTYAYLVLTGNIN